MSQPTQSYTFTDLYPEGHNSYANALNNRGEVAGRYFDSNGHAHGFIYNNGAYVSITAPGAVETYADAINDKGEVAGYYRDSSDHSHGYTYNNGHLFTINAPGAS